VSTSNVNCLADCRRTRRALHLLIKRFNQYDIKELDTMMMSIVKPLSADAPAFHPFCEYEAPEFCIFNDGVPSLVMPSERDLVDLLHGIQENGLDEFPLDAVQAAELEDVEAFVELLAMLAFMEDQEEDMRSSFAGFKKRWESRRAEGLVGRPRAATHRVVPAKHGGGLVHWNKNINEKSIISHAHQHRFSQNNKVFGHHGHHPMTATNSKRAQKPRPIQQPRKQN
jgi:hypothetical protein